MFISYIEHHVKKLPGTPIEKKTISQITNIDADGTTTLSKIDHLGETNGPEIFLTADQIIKTMNVKTYKPPKIVDLQKALRRYVPHLAGSLAECDDTPYRVD